MPHAGPQRLTTCKISKSLSLTIRTSWRKSLRSNFLLRDVRSRQFPQLSFSEAELLRTKTGLLASMFPASWHERDVEREAGSGARLTYLGRTISACPVLLVVTYDIRLRRCEGDTLDIMSLGCVMQNLWLMSESLGISLQILSAVSENEVQNRLRRILAMPATHEHRIRRQTGLCRHSIGKPFARAAQNPGVHTSQSVRRP